MFKLYQSISLTTEVTLFDHLIRSGEHGMASCKYYGHKFRQLYLEIMLLKENLKHFV